METKFKNKTLVRQGIGAIWNPYRIDSAYKKYENGMSVEDIIATDYADIEKLYCTLLVVGIIYFSPYTII